MSLHYEASVSFTLSWRRDRRLVATLYKYSCAFCKTEYSNRSTHNIHLKSEEHTEVRLVVQLKLERLNKKHLQKDYGTTNVNDILDVYENVCHVEWNI